MNLFNEIFPDGFKINLVTIYNNIYKLLDEKPKIIYGFTCIDCGWHGIEVEIRKEKMICPNCESNKIYRERSKE